MRRSSVLSSNGRSRRHLDSVAQDPPSAGRHLTRRSDLPARATGQCTAHRKPTRALDAIARLSDYASPSVSPGHELADRAAVATWRKVGEDVGDEPVQDEVHARRPRRRARRGDTRWRRVLSRRVYHDTHADRRRAGGVCCSSSGNSTRSATRPGVMFERDDDFAAGAQIHSTHSSAARTRPPQGIRCRTDTRSPAGCRRRRHPPQLRGPTPRPYQRREASGDRTVSTSGRSAGHT